MEITPLQAAAPIPSEKARPIAIIKAHAKELANKGKERLLRFLKKTEKSPREMLEKLNEFPKAEADTHGGDVHPEKMAGDPTPIDKEIVSYPLDVEGKTERLNAIRSKLEESGKVPEPGQSAFLSDAYTGDDKEALFGQLLTSGKHNDIYIDRKNREVAHLWKITFLKEQQESNHHQMEVYRDNAGRHRFFQFTREVPGGWVEPEIIHQGNLKEYLDGGGKLTQSQVDQTITDLHEMQEIAQEAHGDIVKNPYFVREWNQWFLTKNLEEVKPYGYINYQNILVSPTGELIIRDFAGNADPFATGGWKDPEAHDPKSKPFMHYELKFFEEGLRSLISKPSESMIGTQAQILA